MKTIEELLREIKIRFGENWQEQKLLFNAVDRENEHYNSEALGAQNIILKITLGYNIYGCLYEFVNGKYVWATAKITEKPEKWVIEKNTEHPMWERFKEFYTELMVMRGGNCAKLDDDYFKRMKYFADDGATSAELHQIELPLQYLTIDQWAELFLDEPKEDSEFEKAVKPAIRYLLKNYNPHTKIMIDYDTAELLSGEAVVSLSNEVPD